MIKMKLLQILTGMKSQHLYQQTTFVYGQCHDYPGFFVLDSPFQRHGLTKPGSTSSSKCGSTFPTLYYNFTVLLAPGVDVATCKKDWQSTVLIMANLSIPIDHLHNY